MQENTYLSEAKEILEGLLSRLEMTAALTAKPGEEGEKDMILLASEESGRIIGKKGQTLEALELLVNRILRKRHKEEESSGWIVLDVDGYHIEVPSRKENGRDEAHGHHRSSRMTDEEEQRLQAMAQDIAKEVKKFGKPRVIGPFAPAERRIIHLALEKDPEVQTVSDAEADSNRCKRITISLKSEG